VDNQGLRDDLADIDGATPPERIHESLSIIPPDAWAGTGVYRLRPTAGAPRWRKEEPETGYLSRRQKTQLMWVGAFCVAMVVLTHV
jgi:hypothetical protein